MYATVISIHAPREGVRQLAEVRPPVSRKHFNPRTPRGGATEFLESIDPETSISIHAPREGVRRPVLIGTILACLNFNPRTPRGGATDGETLSLSCRMYFNPRTPRGGATNTVKSSKTSTGISIHAPREGVRPQLLNIDERSTNHFNPRTPRGGATCILDFLQFLQSLFQSTHPARGCDDESKQVYALAQILFQSTHPARGCDLIHYSTFFLKNISIHAPREGVRRLTTWVILRIIDFNPRTPRGGATNGHFVQLQHLIFQSTHPARGCDKPIMAPVGVHMVFQSTHPARGCDSSILVWIGFRLANFNPRTPRGGATRQLLAAVVVVEGISIHAPREGVRRRPQRRRAPSHNFNPRTPRGGATVLALVLFAGKGISIHAPREGVRRYATATDRPVKDFNPRTPRGGATSSQRPNKRHQSISIHAPREGVRQQNCIDFIQNSMQVCAKRQISRFKSIFLTEKVFKKGVSPPFPWCEPSAFSCQLPLRANYTSKSPSGS